MQTQQQHICTTEPETPCLLGHPEPNITHLGTELILSLAILIRSVALLIQVLAPIVRKSNK
jgi:hypothetical protein